MDLKIIRKMVRVSVRLGWVAIWLFLFIGIFWAKHAKLYDSAKSSEIVKGKFGEKIDRYLTRITPFGFSGALLVARDGTVILNKGYGLAFRSKGIPNIAETVFSVESITKQFTAAAVMKLEMQGKLNTSDPITKFFKGVPEGKKGITLHHLLTHTSGVLNYSGPDYAEAERDECKSRCC